MPIIPSGDPRAQRPAPTLPTDKDMQLLDLLALPVICSQLREARR